MSGPLRPSKPRPIQGDLAKEYGPIDMKATYHGKVFFVTGVTGFLGKILLEKLLRSCNPKKVYVLIRVKRKKTPIDRFNNEILTSKIWTRLRKESGSEAAFRERHVSKIVPVAGDVVKKNLGISEEYLKEMETDLNYIFHCAATINFDEPLIEAVRKNVLGALSVLELAHRAKNLECHLHVSTAYVNSNRIDKQERLYEKIYPVPYDPEEMLSNILNENPAALVAQTPSLLGNYPNTYTFTKNLAEHLLVKRRGNLPLAIFRPTIVGAADQEPMPGWIDALSAASAIYVAAGLGLLTVLNVDENNIGDQVPADMVINAAINGCAHTARRKDQLDIYQLGTSSRNPLRWSRCYDVIYPYWDTRPPAKQFRPVSMTLTNNTIYYKFLFFLKYTMPAKMFGAYAKVLGDVETKKTAKQLQMLEKKLSKLTKTFSFFIDNMWTFDTHHIDEVFACLSAEDQAEFNCDVATIDWDWYLRYFCFGMKKYAMNEDGCVEPKLDRNVKLNLEWRIFGDTQYVLFHNPLAASRSGHGIAETKSLVLFSPRVQQAIKNVALLEGSSILDAELRAKDILTTMTGEVNMPVMRAEGYLFRKFYRNLYQGIVVDEPGVLRIIEQQQKESRVPLIIMPTHRSYMDFLIVSFVFFYYEMKLPFIASGDDFLNMAMVSWIFRHSGAFFMRRAFGKDELYRAIFVEYIHRVLCQGGPFEFFIEGTRSRSGKTLSPKMGVLSIVMSSLFEQNFTDLKILPVSISYEKMVEENVHMSELLGDAKRKPTTSALVSAAVTRVLNLNYGRINLQFGEPISVKSYLSDLAADPEFMVKNSIPSDDAPPPVVDASVTAAATPPPSPVTPLTPAARTNIARNNASSVASFSSPSSSIAHNPHLAKIFDPRTPEQKAIPTSSSSTSASSIPPSASPSTSKTPTSNTVRWKAAVERLGYQIVRENEKQSMCMSTQLVSSLVLSNRQGIPKDELVSQYAWLVRHIEARGGRVDPVPGTTAEVVTRAIGLLANLVEVKRHMVEISVPQANDFKSIVLLSVYRNSLIHLFYAEAVLVCAYTSLVSSGSNNNTSTTSTTSSVSPSSSFNGGSSAADGLFRTAGALELLPSQVANSSCSPDDLLEAFQFLDTLLRNEFPHNRTTPEETKDVFDAALKSLLEKEVFRQALESGRVSFRSATQSADADSDSGGVDSDEDEDDDEGFTGPLFRKEDESTRLFLFLSSLVQPFVDTYWLACTAIRSLRPRTAVGENSLVQRMQWLSEKCFFQNTLNYYETVSKDTLRNALLTYKAMGLVVMKEGTVQLASEREGLRAFTRRIEGFRQKPLMATVDDFVAPRL
eukprot:TRINITY_DN5159_c0_g1_i1.p1 TRINITY_DN5159_c0_g1~~TRINITY_DN5159_c0_g1_i1.p1  ORF type:complete len:1326 (-),score=410.75 TRINITY_DN5159_c0_g1_i1:83-4060(-)